MFLVPGGIASPDMLHVVDTTMDSVTLEWESYEGPPQPPPVTYKIFKRLTGKTSWTKVSETRERRVKVVGLNKATPYDFSVQQLRENTEKKLFEVSAVSTKDAGKSLAALVSSD